MFYKNIILILKFYLRIIKQILHLNLKYNRYNMLNKVLNILEKYEINMSYIDSRPSRKELGEYVFYIDFIGHIEDSNIALALIEIQQQTKMLEILSDGAICI